MTATALQQQSNLMKQRRCTAMKQFRPYSEFPQWSQEESLRRSEAFLDYMGNRRTVREFSDRPVAREVVDNCLRAAMTAPSGANQHPWTFVVVDDDALRNRLREAAEEEERQFYSTSLTSPSGEAMTYLSLSSPPPAPTPGRDLTMVADAERRRD